MKGIGEERTECIHASGKDCNYGFLSFGVQGSGGTMVDKRRVILVGVIKELRTNKVNDILRGLKKTRGK